MPEFVATPNEHLILPFLSAHFNDPTPIEFRSFKLTQDYEDLVMSIVASTSLPTSPVPHRHADDIQADTGDAELSLSLSFLRVRDFDMMHTIVKRACEVLPLSKLEFLSIFSPIIMIPVINWGEVFQHCIEVTTVQVYGHGSISLLVALLPPPQRSHEKGRKRRRGDNVGGTQFNNNDNTNCVSAPAHAPMFPKLTSLLLEMLFFDILVSGTYDIFDLILETVKRRKATKTPLTTLCIDQRQISAEEASELEKVVPDFRWDHNEGSGEAGDEDEDGEDE